MLLAFDSKTSTAAYVEQCTFDEIGIRETRDLQPMILANPAILGEELLVLGPEFHEFEASKDRVDILALDKDATVVIIELKRDESGSYSDLQALRYAARFRSLKFGDAVEILHTWKSKTGSTKAECQEAIMQFLEWEEEGELADMPRVILASAGFSKELLTTVLYLAEYEVPIACIALKPHRVNSSVVIVPDQLLPLREEAEYRRGIQVKETSKAHKSRTPRERTMKILADRDLVRDGDAAFLKHHLPKYVIYDPDSPRFRGKLIRRGATFNVIWEADGNEYSLSDIATRVFMEEHPAKTIGGQNGAWFWGTAEESYWTMAEAALSPGSPAVQGS